MEPCKCERPYHECHLVVLTGGPGAGKTAVLELARKSLCEHVAVLPEAASIVFGGGFPRGISEVAREASQIVIFHTQSGLERIAIGEKRAAVALCDRGTIDGLAYWPGAEEEYWKATGTTREREMERYHAVIHLRTPSASQGYNLSNPVRIESNADAVRLDERLIQVWQGHPRHYVVESSTDFLSKAQMALELIRQQLPVCCQAHELRAK